MTKIEQLKQAILDDAVSKSIGAKDRTESAKAVALLTIAFALEAIASDLHSIEMNTRPRQ